MQWTLSIEQVLDGIVQYTQPDPTTATYLYYTILEEQFQGARYYILANYYGLRWRGAEDSVAFSALEIDGYITL